MKFKILSHLFLLAAFGTALLAADAPRREIAITANDAMQYNIKELTAKPGEALSVKLSHIGKLPKTAMGHNWVLIKPMSAEEFNAFTMKCAQSAPDYLPGDRSAIIANTKLLGGGESDTITFNAPAKPGEYIFLCTFPGHFAMMKGSFIVK